MHGQNKTKSTMVKEIALQIYIKDCSNVFFSVLILVQIRKFSIKKIPLLRTLNK
jgi:hypothetical protein